ncbi:MAG: bifunctional phosphopantothenoylcysteine decarboxylase/phosphopantothenate--cysteine ligase CoaBC [Methanospirillum sp.]|nr:bifunctional phosphopantothenoylcysteine decarboxylase/phosphopantothenate--cysteine ligase CoaBC [Methanospirillum sp.]
MDLSGKTVVLAVTGSIAAVETIRLAHALKRKGAVVQPVMSPAACFIIHPDALTYACGRETITRISGHVEHVIYCGDEGQGDLLLIAPCTANTISKIACGIDDTPVTTFATTALGRKMPVILVPAMHHAMFRHEMVMENLEKLTHFGITVVGPRIEEGKAKIADSRDIVLWCERLLSGMPLSGRRVVITSGRCEEPVDDVRVLTTRSSGMIGKELAFEAFRLGAEVTIIHRDTIGIGENIPVTTAASMGDAVKRILSAQPVDIYISAAAVSDFAPVRVEGKIPSGTDFSLRLLALPKILDLAEGIPLVVGFKLGEHAQEEAKDLLSRGVQIVLTNTAANLGTRDGRYTLVDRSGPVEIAGTKEEIAARVFGHILEHHHP